jgi:DNA ligase (NAD+)
LKKWGFRTGSRVCVCSGADAVISFFEKIGKERDSLPFEIDGVVVKVNTISLQQELVVSPHHISEPEVVKDLMH